MVEVQKFILKVVKTRADDPNAIEKRKDIPITPTDNENPLEMKKQVAERLKKEKESEKWTYWYLVIKIETKTGPQYRTVTKKVFF